MKQLAGKVREGADGRVRACRSFFRAYGHYPVESGMRSPRKQLSPTDSATIPSNQASALSPEPD